ncbi:uncharacterized protein KY384_000805 [Bacidia gigantensis]|uniref:uncharacterized protein n=1 Tax=Bacidia gigantensis TaxID=2732470 RepID=UPI001D03BC6A|nr:uncharacterized protein KY384_000805 [Bacidia gigantensis]KAG8526043.1 hypothetical protein KY384_000805 [Bacidia gigantensis]
MEQDYKIYQNESMGLTDDQLKLRKEVMQYYQSSDATEGGRMLEVAEEKLRFRYREKLNKETLAFEETGLIFEERASREDVGHKHCGCKSLDQQRSHREARESIKQTSADLVAKIVADNEAWMNFQRELKVQKEAGEYRDEAWNALWHYQNCVEDRRTAQKRYDEEAEQIRVDYKEALNKATGEFEHLHSDKGGSSESYNNQSPRENTSLDGAEDKAAVCFIRLSDHDLIQHLTERLLLHFQVVRAYRKLKTIIDECDRRKKKKLENQKDRDYTNELVRVHHHSSFDENRIAWARKPFDTLREDLRVKFGEVFVEKTGSFEHERSDSSVILGPICTHESKIEMSKHDWHYWRDVSAEQDFRDPDLAFHPRIGPILGRLGKAEKAYDDRKEELSKEYQEVYVEETGAFERKGLSLVLDDGQR